MARKSVRRVQGIGAGLLPKDLNARAQVALLGLSDTPKDDIVALLRSDQPIDQKTRAWLADAIVRKPRGLTFKLSNSRKPSWLMRLLRGVAHVSQGRSAERRIKEVGYDAAMSELATTMLLDEKSAMSRVALARKVDAWIGKVRAEMPEHSELDSVTLEAAYVLARVDKIKPEAAIDETLPQIVDLIRQFRELQDKALGPDEWFVA